MRGRGLLGQARGELVVAGLHPARVVERSGRSHLELENVAGLSEHHLIYRAAIRPHVPASGEFPVARDQPKPSAPNKPAPAQRRPQRPDPRTGRRRSLKSGRR
jgi:hypothetical protein